MNKVIHFEIPADDLARVKKFYGEVFGWSLQDEPIGDEVYTHAVTSPLDENHMHKEKGAINGGIFKRTSELPNPIITISVSSIDEHAARIEASGGKLVVPKGEVPEMGYYAYFKDTEGNLMGLWEDIRK
jgi:uncharacterized protein